MYVPMWMRRLLVLLCALFLLGGCFRVFNGWKGAAESDDASAGHRQGTTDSGVGTPGNTLGEAGLWCGDSFDCATDACIGGACHVVPDSDAAQTGPDDAQAPGGETSVVPPGPCAPEADDADGDGMWDGTGSAAGCPEGLVDQAPGSSTRCHDVDGDGCDDCSSGSFDPARDGVDSDRDGICDAGDPFPGDPGRCIDQDHDTCDDCSNGYFNPNNDGPDADHDGVCDAVDQLPDDSSLILHYTFNSPLDPFHNDASGDDSYAGVPEGTSGFVFDAERGGVLQNDPAGGFSAAGYQGVLGNAALTVAAWIKISAIGGIITWGDSPAFTVGVASRIVEGVLCLSTGSGADDLCGTDPVADGRWHHVAVVVPAGGATRDIVMYVDGNPQVQLVDASNRTVNTGAGSAVALGSLNGLVDDLRLYNRALALSEVRSLFASRPCTVQADCDDNNVCTRDTCLGSGVCDSISVSCNPHSCEQLWADEHVDTDGDYTLFLGNDAAKAFSAYCLDMGSAPKTYLNLVHTDSGNGRTHNVGENFSYHAPGAGEQELTAWYTKVRLNPLLPSINTDDRTFAATLGNLAGTEWRTSESIPFGTGAACVSGYNAAGRANIDLRGTPFAVDPAQQWGGSGYQAAGRVTFVPDTDPANPPHDDRKVVNITGGGYCGQWAPVPCQWQAVRWGQASLRLSWQPDN
jgi:hypothetical protein